MDIQRRNEYDYEHKELIGTGSGGNRVYKIQDVHSKKKILLSTQHSKEFLNETNILQKINHPNIIKYYEGFTKKHTFYLILEYADCGDLRRVIDEHKRNSTTFKQDDVLFYAQQIAKAISYIHSKNILHRDIKPENIFICKDNTVKLGDFGVSKQLSASINFTTTGIGTPYYISPEICRGEKYNHKSDIWAFGCVLYEMLTLKRPFNYSNINALIYNIVNTAQATINDDGLYCKELIALVDHMLNKQWDKRPSIGEVCAIIDDIVNCSKRDNNDNNSSNSSGNNEQTTCATACVPSVASLANNNAAGGNGITLLNVLNSKLKNLMGLNSKLKNFMNFTNGENDSSSPQKSSSISSRALLSTFTNAQASYGHQQVHPDDPPRRLGTNHSNNINDHIKLAVQGGAVRNRSVPKKVYEKGETLSKYYEIQKKKTEDLQKKLKGRVFSKDTRGKKGSNGNGSQETRRHLIHNFLEEKYGKEVLTKIETYVQQQDVALLCDLLGEDEYLKNKKYFKYLSNS